MKMTQILGAAIMLSAMPWLWFQASFGAPDWVWMAYSLIAGLIGIPMILDMPWTEIITIDRGL